MTASAPWFYVTWDHDTQSYAYWIGSERVTQAAWHAASQYCRTHSEGK